MRQSSGNEASEASIDSIVIEQLLRLEDRAALLERSRKASAERKNTRLGRVQSLVRESPRRTLRQKARVSLSAARILVTGGSASPQTVKPPTTPPEKLASPGEPRPSEYGSLAEADVIRRSTTLKPAVESGRKLVAATIMDAFTRSAFEPEFEIVDLHPESWLEELERANADLLFIESAWRGDRESWYDTLQTKPQEIIDIVAWCQANDIPTVFWNKEDPVYYHRWVKVAALFDHVFTTDLESIPRYVADLGHTRVHVLPFAAQPRMCNPIELEERREAAVFAGSYYENFKQRNVELFAQLDGVGRVLPVEIYDRNYGSDKSFFQWPEPYRQLVVGTLPPDRLDTAYKGYRIALNVNTVTESQTMLARRAFDLLASGTPTISNFSRSIKVLFGDLVMASNSADQLEAFARQILNDPDTTDKRRAMGVRHILREHTYGVRWQYVVSTVSGVKASQSRPRIGIIGVANNPEDVARWVELSASQARVDTCLSIIANSAGAAQHCSEKGIPCVIASDAGAVTVKDAVGHGVEAVAVLHPDNWYGPFYLESLLGGLTYSTAGAAAKTTRYRAADTDPEIIDRGHEYRWWNGDTVGWHRALVRIEHCGDLALTNLFGGAALPPWLEVLGTDRFDYLEQAPASPAAYPALSASLPIHSGADFDAIAAAGAYDLGSEVPAEAFPASATVRGGTEGTIVTACPEGVVVAWSYQDAKNKYLPFRQQFAVADLAPDGVLHLQLRPHGSGFLGVNVSWIDKHGSRIPGLTYRGELAHRIDVPENAAEIQLSLNLRGEGKHLLQSVTLSATDPQPPPIMEGWSSRTLIVTDNYPAYDDLYRNGFVHTRVRGYRERGRESTIFVMRQGQPTSHREYQGVPVITGSREMLRRLLASGHFDHVLVHFLKPAMWQVLRNFRGQIPIVVWVHGAEIQPYWRRDFNYRTESERDQAREASEGRMKMWREVAMSDARDITYVVVSHAFRDEIMGDLSDLGIELPSSAVHVINNPVDTELFGYSEKDPDQRKRILLIRPFMSRAYANDLAVAAIERLSAEPWFGELSFRVIGDGPLFAEVTKPLAKHANVLVERKFLPQPEIAALHREYGVFLVPTRHDTQGVSRGEAMSSGLVPVTNDLPAIREFLTDEEGYIAPYDDAVGLAEAISELYHHPEIFTAKSRAAATRIRQTIASSIVLDQEIAMFAASPTGPADEGDSL